MAKAYKRISGDSHLEVPSERWTHRVDAKYRDGAPRTVTDDDGADATVVPGLPPRQNPMDLYGGLGRDAVYGGANIVKPDFIRVEADELSYNMHIMIRFEIERAMMRGDLSVSDIPGVWNQKYKEYLDLDVPESLEIPPWCQATNATRSPAVRLW